jgi:hypothetical protein
MRHLAAALTFRGAIDADAISFDPTIGDESLPRLTRPWPSLRDRMPDRGHDARMARILSPVQPRAATSAASR